MNFIRGYPSGTRPRVDLAVRRLLERRPVVMLMLALVGLSQTGCQSGFCRPCGGFGQCFSGLSNRISTATSRVFRPKSGCCPGELGVEAGPMPYGPPVKLSPLPGGGSSLVPPGINDLQPAGPEPIPSASPGPPPSGTGGDSSQSQGAKSSTGKANYEASRPRLRDGLRRLAPPARSLASSPEPTFRSAQGAPSSSPTSATSSEPNPLDNLPPLDLPRDSSELDSNTPPATPAPGPAPAAEVLPGPAPAPTAVAPGIRRFSGVETKLAGGSVPLGPGLDWLAEKGYKTLLDLRTPAEIPAAFTSEAARRGLRYITLPVGFEMVDADHVARFEFELSLADARPLFFFDADGSRASVLWFIHRVTVDKVDPQVARRDGEELGVRDERLWLAATVYLDSLKPTPASAPKSASNAPEAPTAGPAPVPAPKAAALLTPPSLPAPRDPTAWRPLAAFIVTGLAAPLAYFSSSAIPTTLRAIARASLPAPARSRYALPRASDV